MIERNSERINTALNVKYFYCNELCSGIIKNLSEIDMYMKANLCFPYNTIFEVLIPSENGILNVPVKVYRIHRNGNYYIGMGLKLMEQPEKYLNFINTLKFALED
jgi:hypothetical protein